jgi:hypothetical protein
MNNTALVQLTKRAKGARAKASLHLKERKAKASINTTDTPMTGGTLPQAPIDRGTIRMTTHNGILHMTKANGPATTRAKTPKGGATAEGEVGTMGTSPATTMALTPTFIKTLLTLTRHLIHPLSRFNETFSDVRDRQGRLIRRGVVLPPDLHTTQELEPNDPESTESDLPSQDGAIALRKQPTPIPTSNRYQALSDLEDTSPHDSSPNDAPTATKEPTNVSNMPDKPTELKSHKNWQYVPIGAPTGTGDRKNDGPKSTSFFQAVPTAQGSERRSSRIQAQSITKPTTPATILSILTTSPEKYNDELDNLLSCLESKVPPDLCLMSTPRTSALHATFSGEIDGRDPKSQKEIHQLPPEEAKRYNDATIAEFNGMKKKQVMELVPSSSLPYNTKVYPSVVNWTTKKVLGIYSKTKCRICFGGHRYDKTYTDCFAPTVNFTTVLMVLCLGTMFDWTFGSLDYSQAYLNADIDEQCFMRAPESLREYDDKGDEMYWRLKKVIYGHPKGSRLWADCLHKKLDRATRFHTIQNGSMRIC